MKDLLFYTINLPTTMVDGKKYPVLYLMHGIGSNEEDMLTLVGELKEDFILISIRGEYEREDGYSHYSIHGFGLPDRKSFDKCIERIQSLIDYTGRLYPLDTTRQYLLGFSQGAALSMSLALTLGNKIKGIIALSGYIPAFVKEDYHHEAVDKVSIFISHGTHDPIFPLRYSKESEEFFLGRSRKVCHYSYLSRHEVTKENQKDFIQWIYEDVKEIG